MSADTDQADALVEDVHKAMAGLSIDCSELCLYVADYLIEHGWRQQELPERDVDPG